MSHALAASISFEDERLVVTLQDGTIISVSLAHFPRLARATNEERSRWRLIADGEGICWECIDEDLSLRGIFKAMGQEAEEDLLYAQAMEEIEKEQAQFELDAIACPTDRIVMFVPERFAGPPRPKWNENQSGPDLNVSARFIAAWGDGAVNEITNSSCPEDCHVLEGNLAPPSEPGLWLFEGRLWWDEPSYYENESDLHASGHWRRLTSPELDKLLTEGSIAPVPAAPSHEPHVQANLPVDLDELVL